MKLYEIAREYRVLADAIDANNGELTPELSQALDEIGGTFRDKIDSCVKMAREYERKAEAFKAESDRLADRSRAATNAAKRIKEYTRYQMELMGEDRVETDTFTVSIGVASQPTIRFVGPDVNELPDTYLRHKVEFDSKAAQAALKNGDDLPPGIEVTRTRFLQVR